MKKMNVMIKVGGFFTSFLITNQNSINKIDYQNSGFEEIFTGTKIECLDFIDNFKEENYILEEHSNLKMN